MSEKEEKESGFIGQIRRLSRRLSGNILSADFKDVRAYMVRNDNKRNIYTYDHDEQLRIGGILCKDLAEEFGTPLYVYDINRIHDNYNLFTGSLKSKNFSLCFSVKANPNLAILNILSRLGAGFDVSSGGEIARCLAAGIDPSKITFSGCGKSLEEIELAIKSGIYCINAESWEELDRIEIMAVKYNKIQNIAIRVNPDLNQETLHGHHQASILAGTPYSGVPMSEALEIYSRAKASSTLRIKGISCNVGPHISQLESYLEIRDKILHLADELRQESKICVEHIDFGGDFAANLNAMGADSSDISNWIDKIAAPIVERGLKLVLEPGRSFIADTAALLTKIEYIKTIGKEVTSGTTSPKTGSFIGREHPNLKSHFTKKSFAIIDAGFNDFAHTALFGQQHNIVLMNQQSANSSVMPTEYKYDIVGPTCEQIDVFYRDFQSNHKLIAGDYLVISDSGSYGSSMCSNFMSRNKAAEVLITERTPIVIRERQKYEEQYQHEKMIPEMKLKSSQILEEAESQEELLAAQEENNNNNE